MDMSTENYNWGSPELANPGKRYQGQFIDGLISLALFGASIYFFKSLHLDSPLIDVLIILIPFSYFALSDSLPKGQSLGKKLLNISVVSKETGKPCTVWQSLVRNMFTPILGAIDAIAILGRGRQRLGDMMAGTIVIKMGN